MNKTRVTPEAHHDNLPDDSVQPIVVELRAICEAITLGFNSLREAFTFLPPSYPRPSSFEGSSSLFAHSDRSENAAAGPSGTFQDDDEELGGSFTGCSEYI